MQQNLQELFAWLRRPFRFIVDEDDLEKTYFRLPKYYLELMHQWPIEGRVPCMSRFVMGVNWSVLFFVIFTSVKEAIETFNQDPGSTLRALGPVLTMPVTFMKLLHLANRRVEFRHLIVQLCEHLEEDSKESPDKREIIKKFAEMSIKHTIILTIWGVFTECFIVVRPVIYYLYALIKQGPSVTQFHLDLPFRISLPYMGSNYESDEFLHNTMCIVISQTVTTTIIGYLGVDGAFLYLCLALSAAQRNLQQGFRKAFDKYAHMEVLSTTQNEELRRELSRLQHRRDVVMCMSKELERLYRPIILTHFSFAALNIGCSATVVMFLIKDSERGVYIGHVFALCTQLYIYCLGAEHLNTNTQNLGHCLYDCAWYKCDVRNQKIVIISIGGAQHGCDIDVPFFSPSLQVFQTIIRTAASYITLLQAFLNKDLSH